MSAPRRGGRGLDTALVFAVALLARLAVVAWAAGRIPPTADGTFYDRIAGRIAQGLGYTVLWPDGVVTYAAHYPVGYPALIGAVYAFTGAHPGAAMALNAALGALGALAVHRLALRMAAGAPRGRALALAAGLLVALHPGLVAYTPAIMTEGVTASLLACAAAVAAWARDRGAEPRSGSILPVALTGLVLGVATLVRPQSLALAPIFGLLAVPVAASWRRRAAALAVATAVAVAVCAPWTARNCVRMKHCALVSVNGGWNLLIGTDAAANGAWAEIKVPDACREVFDEAQKDVCFGREARRVILAQPAAWLGLVPKKLAATFDYAGAAPWYLHQANGTAFPYDAKVRLGAAETIFERVMLLAALAWAARRASEGEGAIRWVRVGVAVIGGAFLFMKGAWVAYAALVIAALLRGRALWRGPVLPGAAIAVLAATMATHAVFFGAGRYSMVVFPLVTALAPFAVGRRAEG